MPGTASTTDCWTAFALLNTNARPDSAESAQNRRRLMDLAGRDFEGVIAALLPRQMTKEHLGNPRLVATITAMAHAVGAEAFLRQQAAIIGRVDSRASLAKIGCPTLVLAAREDAIMPMEVSEEMARGIPGARLEVVEHCGHVSSIEQPEAVSALLRTWISVAQGPGRE